MQEMWIPEFFMALFLFLYIARPFIKKLKPLSGLSWLPLLSFLIGIILFPAYGFRPEAVPLTIYAGILTISSFLNQAKNMFRTIRKARVILAVPPMFFLAATAGIAFYFTPQKDMIYNNQGIYALKAASGAIEDSPGISGAKEREYFIRVYTDENDTRQFRRPLLVLLPPALGSWAAADQVSSELRNRGFTVLTYSRRGFDSPAVHLTGEYSQESYGISPAEWFRRVNAFFMGTASAGANASGRALEEARENDLLFLMSWIQQNPMLDERTHLFNISSRDSVFLAGYDAGGSALILLGNSLSSNGTAPQRVIDPAPAIPEVINIPDILIIPEMPNNPNQITIRGLVAIESYFWSIYREEALDIPSLPQEAGWLASVQHGLNRWYLEKKSKKITGLGQIPRLSTPLLFLVSDRGRDMDNQYLAMGRIYQAARSSAALASVDGAGPLDYSDYPVQYPLITAIFRGRHKPVFKNYDRPARTADIITHFAAGLLETGEGQEPPFKNAVFPQKVHFQRK